MKLHDSNLELVEDNWNKLYALYFGFNNANNESSSKQLRVIKKKRIS
jgi:hypothetical protein